MSPYDAVVMAILIRRLGKSVTISGVEFAQARHDPSVVNIETYADGRVRLWIEDPVIDVDVVDIREPGRQPALSDQRGRDRGDIR